MGEETFDQVYTVRTVPAERAYFNMERRCAHGCHRVVQFLCYDVVKYELCEVHATQLMEMISKSIQL